MPKNLKTLFSLCCIGIITGGASGLFLYILEKVTNLRNVYIQFIFLLPIFGVLLKKMMRNLPESLSDGIVDILEKRKTSPWLAPFIFTSSLGTHLFGGSAGREGVGVLMGTSISQMFRKNDSLKESLITIGVASGFSAIFGTPLAAVFFALELEKFSNISLKRVYFLVVTSLVAFFTSTLISKHTIYPVVNFNWGIDVVLYVVSSSLSVAVAGILFFETMKNLVRLNLSVFWISILIVLMIFIFNLQKITGIGLELLQESLVEEQGFQVFFFKFLLTTLTLSVGFKGGEVTPLFIMGSILSTFFAGHLGLTNIGLSGSLGMLGLFGALANAPIAAGIMGLEIFGWEIGLLVFVVSFTGKMALRDRSIYK